MTQGRVAPMAADPVHGPMARAAIDRPRLVATGALAAILAAGSVGATAAASPETRSAGSCVARHHPLDPLDRRELRSTMAIIDADPRFPEGAFFPTISLLEPSKDVVRSASTATPVPRRALADVYDRAANVLSRVEADLCSRTVTSWTAVKGAQPPIHMTEWTDADAIVRADPRWQEAMRARGLEPDDVYVDIWAPGDVSDVPNPDDHRLLRALSFLKADQPNPYDRPIEGVVVTIDMTDGRVLRVTDSGARPVASDESGDAARARAPLPPLTGPAPRRSALRVDGRDVSWQGWHFRVDYSPRSGVVLHEIGYGRDEVRPIIYRLALSEVWVPYADPDPDWAWHAAFDVGEYNLGQYASPLKVGIDVPRGTTFLDEVVAYDTKADGLFTLPHATAIYERQIPATWSRVDPTTLERDARGGRELVVAAEYAIGNYDYGIDYVFGLDGAITVEARATGTVLSKGVADAAEATGHGTHVAPFLGAPDHQHFLSFRIDLDVDGTANRVVQEDTMTEPGGEANAFVVRRTPVATEGGLDPDPDTNRSWRIESTERANALGAPTAYRISPTDWTVPFSTESYVGLHGAAFAEHPLWVTTYEPRELYIAGDYPIGLGHGADGIAEYASPPAALDGTDVVAWYTLGLTHHPEVEEYPVLNSHRMSFRITPSGFFDRNPALDLPR